jgi:hypothetical protein
MYDKYKKPLNFVLNESKNQDIFPDLLKIAKITPLYKKGNRQEIINYRLISVIYILKKFRKNNV